MTTGVTVTWWGHATTTVVDRGVRVLTDPLLTPGLAHLRRRRGPQPGSEAARADVVLISHLHADHLHLTSLAMVDPAAPVVVPAGAPALVPGLRRLRRELIELAPGNECSVGGLRITAVLAEHDGRRWPWSRGRVLSLGYVLDGAVRTWFGGDTDLHDHLAEAVDPVDVALVPVGGWGPTLGPGHLDPERAAEAVAAVGARAAVPIHFGTLWPVGLDRVRPDRFLRPGADFAAAVRRSGGTTVVTELVPGGSVAVPAPP
jgi:L-ascorbate metabolism protein UlaG (beta-lactamase superfamily)